MKKSLFVASVMSKISLPKTERENDINWPNIFGHNKSRVSDILLPDFENILWHFVSIPVSGEVQIVFANKRSNKTVRVDVPATTEFLATCIQAKNSHRQLTFGASLS